MILKNCHRTESKKEANKETAIIMNKELVVE